MNNEVKKTSRGDGSQRPLKWKRLLLTIKLLSVFAFVSCLTASASAFSQQKVNLNVRSANLSTVLMQITDQTDVKILYNENLLRHVSCEDMDLQNMLVEEALRQVLSGTGFTFVMENGVYVIVRDDEKENGPRVVNGRVVDTQNNPLPGVSVIVKGTTSGTATDVRGNFKLILPDTTSTLVFSFIGMERQEVRYTGQDTLVVTMQEASEDLGEVVVTGYQELDKKTAIGAYSSVKGEDLVMNGTNSLAQMLQGKIPGMMVINDSGLTGQRQRIRVRGTSTILANADPVWVVDGILQEDPLPFEMEDFNATAQGTLDDNMDLMKDFVGSAIDWLNPSDIESITVLKDAAATAIYGTEAANGVIVITTKKGERGAPSVNYYGRYTISQRLNYNRLEYMNSQERVELSREGFARGARFDDESIGYTGLALAFQRGEITYDQLEIAAQKLESLNMDWFDLLYRNPFSHEHSISVGGGDSHGTYRGSVSYTKTMNTAIGNDIERYRGSINFNARWGTKFTLFASLSGAYTKTNLFASGVDPYGYALNTSRVIRAYDDDGELYYYNEGGYKYNILNELANSGSNNTQSSVNINLNLRYAITDNLRVGVQLGGGRSNSFAESWFTEQSHKMAETRGYDYGSVTTDSDEYKDCKVPFGGVYMASESRNFNYTLRLQADYTKLFNDVHTLSLMAGWEVRSSQYDGYSQTTYGYQPDRGKTFAELPLEVDSGLNNMAQSQPTLTDRLSNTASYYASAAYNYKQRYAISFNVRGDANNRFGQDQRDKFSPVWSTGIRWNLSDEPWMTNLHHVFTDVSFMATFGYQANLAEGISPDLTARYNDADFTTGEHSMSIVKRPTPGIKWEKTMSMDYNITWSLFEGRLNGSFSYYYKKTTDLVTERNVALENGVETTYINGGDMTNSGWDMFISLVPVRTKNFTWSLSSTFSSNQNKIKSSINSAEPTWDNARQGLWKKEGYPVDAFWAFKFAGLNPENGGPIIDYMNIENNNAPKDPSLYMVYAGHKDPTTNWGLNMLFRYKRFSLPISIYYVHGGKQFLPNPWTQSDRMPTEYTNVSTELNKRWRQPGDELHTNIPGVPVRGAVEGVSYSYPEGSITDLRPYTSWGYSTARIVDMWYIRFNDFSFSYDLPENWIRGFAKSVRVSVYASNPLQIKSKDLKGRDPEVAMGSQPRERTFSLGLDVRF